MDALAAFRIPVKGLKNELHQFDFQIDSDFFKLFEGSPITEGKFDVRLLFEKRSDLYILTFKLDGTVRTECDRCLELINLPVRDEEQLLVKLTPEVQEEDAEVIYLSPEASELNVAQYIYEYICLAMPLNKVYDCQSDKNRPCNPEMLKYLEQIAEPEAEVEEEDTKEAESPSNPLWEELKKKFKEN